ncbi:MAG: glycosyltransferase family 2 protein [Candidatus Beckwithbacteria bacterium]|nr:glycosyltransferase family 2 protein [Candidatus Beckwithbacteria bacterium]
MTVSVVIPSYNSDKTIRQCLESLIKQSQKPEIIVVDDGSGDNTVRIVRSFSQIKLLTKKHHGPGAARNLGVKNAHGEILVFVDSDMKFDQNFLTDLTKPIMEGYAKGSWSGNELVANWDKVWARCWNYNQNRFSPHMIGSRGQRRVFRAVLKSEFDKVNGFDSTGYTDDWSLVKKLGFNPAVTQAKFYHSNPETLLKIFSQARWIGKRQYKFGKLGTILTIIKSTAGFSVLIGLFKSVIFITPQFLIFKLVYDLGIMLGALENLCFGFYY